MPIKTDITLTPQILLPKIYLLFVTRAASSK